MTPQEVFDLPLSQPPDFFSMNDDRLAELGAHFGLKSSTNLSRILKDIWMRMHEDSANTEEANGETLGAKRNKSHKSSSVKTKKSKTKHINEDKDSEMDSTKSKNTLSRSTSAKDMDEKTFIAILRTHYADLFESIILFIPVDLEKVHSRFHVGGHSMSKARLQQLLDKVLAFVSAGGKSKKVQASSHATLVGSKFTHYKKVNKA
jgi:hypothetical protein